MDNQDTVEITMPSPETGELPTTVDNVQVGEVQPPIEAVVTQAATIETPQEEIKSDNLKIPEEKPKVGRPCGYCKRKEEITKIMLEYRAEIDSKTKPMIPYIEELCLRLDIDEDTINNWATKKKEDGELEHPEFFGTYKRVKLAQKLRLLQRTNGRFNPSGAIFQLKANHGLIESEKKILAGSVNEPLEIIVTEFKTNKDE